MTIQHPQFSLKFSCLILFSIHCFFFEGGSWDKLGWFDEVRQWNMMEHLLDVPTTRQSPIRLMIKYTMLWLWELETLSPKAYGLWLWPFNKKNRIILWAFLWDSTYSLGCFTWDESLEVMTNSGFFDVWPRIWLRRSSRSFSVRNVLFWQSYVKFLKSQVGLAHCGGIYEVRKENHSLIFQGVVGVVRVLWYTISISNPIRSPESSPSVKKPGIHPFHKNC